jgi:cAMP-dependent protein kinase regulator
VEEGQLEARKRTSSGELKRVMEYGAGSYFGELALLREIPRQATIVCLTDCRLLRMDRETFKRLLGPIEYIMERDSAKYEPAK